MCNNDLKVKLLPTAIPPLVGYMEDAQPLSIVFTNQNAYEWIYTNYVQLVYEEPMNVANQPLKFYKPTFTGEMWDAVIPWLVEFKLTTDMIKAFNIDIIELIITAIDMDKYVILLLDEYYLPFRIQYKKFHNTHETFIYGYSEKKHEFYGIAYTKDTNHYNKFSVDMDDLKNGFLNTHEGYEPRRTVKMLSHKEGMFYEFNKKILIRYIDDYLNSFDSLSRYSEFVKTKGGRVYGISIYDSLKSYLSNSDINIIPMQILLEHKQLMIDRINFIKDNEFAYDCDYLLDKFKNIHNLTRMTKLTYMKFSLTNNTKLIDNIIDILDNVKNLEIEAMEYLKNKLINDRNIEENILYSRCGCWNEIAYLIPKIDDTLIIKDVELILINEKTKGFFGFGNEEVLSRYQLPIYIGINAMNNTIFVMDGNCRKEIINIKLESGKKYKFQFLIDIKNNKFSLTASYNDYFYVLENLNFQSGCNLRYIDKLLLHHENSYRFKIKDLVNQNAHSTT